MAEHADEHPPTSDAKFQRDSRIEYRRQEDERVTAAERWGEIKEFMAAQVRINGSLERLLYIVVGAIVTAVVGAVITAAVVLALKALETGG